MADILNAPRLRTKSFLIILGILTLIMPAPAHPQWQEDGKRVPDSPWSRSEGDFGVMLILTDKPQEFFGSWNKGKPHVRISDSAVARMGLPLVAVVAFTGCAPNAGGNCDAGVKYTALKPDARVYGNPRAVELWVGKPPPPKNVLELSVGNMMVIIEPGDPPGLYTMRAEVEDRVTGRKFTLERPFEVTSAGHPK